MVTRGRLLACAAAAAALAIPACGGDGGGVESDDPASLVPADAPVYSQVTLRPQGKLKSDVEALASAVTGLDDPTAKLIQEFNDYSAKQGLRDPSFNFADDVEPWLGGRAGLFAEGFSADPGAAIIQTTDVEATRQAIKAGSPRNVEKHTYKGVDYIIDKGTTNAVVGDFLVLGDEPAFKRVVDVSEGEDSLGDEGEFTDAIDRAPSGSIADFYLNVEAAVEEVRSTDPDDAKAVEGSIGDTSGKTFLASLIPSGDSLELDTTTNIEQTFISADLGELIGSFPAGSFAAVGIPDLGSQVERTIDQLEEAGIEGLSREAIDGQLGQAGLSLDEVASALDDLGVFAQGTDEASLQGAAVITSGDSDVIEKLLRQLTALITLSGQSGVGEAPVGTGFSLRDPEELGRQPLIVTTEGGRIVIGYGQQAAERALRARSPTLAEDPVFRQAVGKLGGEGVSGYVALPGVFRLADSLGAASDPGYRQARPYLNRLSYLIIGGGAQGDFTTSKVIVGVKP